MDDCSVKIARSTPRSKVSLNNNKPFNQDNIKQLPANNKSEKWNRFQELKRRREENESKSNNKKAKKTNVSIVTRKSFSFI